MKTIIFLFVIAGAIIVGSCTPHQHTQTSTSGLPPGQAKKITGSKSAKPYAPGQQKKY